MADTSLVGDSRAKEQHDGVRWLMGAGAAATLIALFVAWSDHTLSTSDSEKRLGETLRELRTAQTTLPGGRIDPRMANTAVVREPAAPAILAAGAHANAHGDSNEGAHHKAQH